VNGAGRELFARARLAQNQHARIMSRNLADQRAHFAHRRRRAGRHVDVTRLFQRRFNRNAQRGGQRGVLERELQALQPGTEGGEQLVGDGAGAICNDRDVGELLAQRGTQLAPVAVRDIADQQGRRSARGLDDGAHQCAVVDEQRLEAQRPQDVGHPFRSLCVAVVDDRTL